MKPTHCPSCHGDDLAHGTLTTNHRVFFRMSIFRSAPVLAATCLGCGAVLPYLDQAALARVRGWNTTAKPTKVTVDEL